MYYCEVGESSLDEENIPDLAYMVSVCAGSIVINDEMVYICHQLLKDYFTAQKSKWFPDAQFYITRICITHLLFTVIESEKALSEDDFNNSLLLNSFYYYSAQYWGSHALKVPDYPDILLFPGKQPDVAASAQVFIWNRFVPSFSHMMTFETIGLYLAAVFGMEEAIKLLLNVYDVNLKGYNNWTPLSFATVMGQKDMIELLLAQSADIESEDIRHRTALSLAIMRGEEAIVDLLMRHGAKVNSHDVFGGTPLLAAIEYGNEAVVRLLLTQGADVELKHTNEDTPLFYAASEGHEAIVELLLASGANIGLGEEDGHPLPYKVKRGQETRAQLLLSHGATVEWV